ncbi:MAG: YueH family protein [Bacillus sp. (in: Bacteria)]|jgi:hypothetical protein|nr:YueH family protein [Bacillus sp. (in: firmicutes)]
MKIRKIFMDNKEEKVFIYENKKEEYFMVAFPSAEWSIQFTYDEFGESLINKLIKSLTNRLNEEQAEALALRIDQWTKEM